jgi:hypothetical protein
MILVDDLNGIPTLTSFGSISITLLLMSESRGAGSKLDLSTYFNFQIVKPLADFRFIVGRLP